MESKSECRCKQSKVCYDIGMSRRTRRPSNVLFPERNLSSEEKVENEKKEEVENDATDGSFGEVEEEEENCKKKSLKQLIERRSLSQHFSEEEKDKDKEKEKELQVIIKHSETALNTRVKFKRMVSRYAKILGHVIKLKRNPNPELDFCKKPVFI